MDGYNETADCDEGNASINPGATDADCNGTDEDCSGSDNCRPFDKNFKLLPWLKSFIK